MKTKNIALLVLLAIFLPVAALLAKVILFPVTVANIATNSAAGVVSKTLSSDNVLTNYEWFFDAKAQFDTRVRQAKTHRTLIAAEKGAAELSRLNMELAAMEQSCRDLAAKYNANSSKMNRSLFKSKDLPESLFQQDCEK